MRKALCVTALTSGVFSALIACQADSNTGRETGGENKPAVVERVQAAQAGNEPKAKPSKTPNGDEIPVFEKNENYAAVREKLIKAGWKPSRSAEGEENCVAGGGFCEKYPELEAGPAAGEGQAIFRWAKAGRILLVSTRDEPPLLTGYELEKASKKVEPEADDSGWQGGALVSEPPSNIRETPYGKVLCVIRQKKVIILKGSTGIKNEDGEWLRTDACGKPGMIHSTQIVMVD